MNKLRIATRGSMLALWQAEHVRTLLLSHNPDLEITLVVLKTQGDRILDRPLSEVGGKGLFTKEIEEALIDHRADLAVHSMKDLPSTIPEGLMLGAIPQREDPADALVLAPVHRPPPAPGPTLSQGANAGSSSLSPSLSLLGALPAGARVGTSSLRRACQLRRLRPDLEIVPLRGNVDTRLRKVDSGQIEAAVLAAAGLIRLGFAARIAACFSPSEMLPACGQGALGLECRADDHELRSLLAKLVDSDATVAVLAERAFSLHLGGSCHTPLGAHAQLRRGPTGPKLTLDGMVGSVDGRMLLRDELSGPIDAPAELGQALGERLLAAGAGALLAQPPAG